MKPGTRDIREMEDGGIDAGLLVLSLYVAQTGRQFSYREIAFVCGWDRSSVYLLEKRAIDKLKRDPRMKTAWKESDL
ncbi:MAG TPA: hypothetical protein VIP46_02745 [Pyrinomonadaceae bacterium]